MTLAAKVKQINGMFRAETCVSVPLSAEAASRDQALAALREAAAKHLNDDEVVIEEESPWDKFSGSWSDESDGEFASYWDEVVRFRQELDKENKMGDFASKGD